MSSFTEMGALLLLVYTLHITPVKGIDIYVAECHPSHTDLDCGFTEIRQALDWVNCKLLHLCIWGEFRSFSGTYYFSHTSINLCLSY